ncbi:MAG: sugar phosphate isomerase/epimerase [Clostridia bacterium]|nr:sugar phosphate isomerase/epimerase [Clostridia bacterium]
MKKPTMAIQLYTLRNFIQTAPDFDATLARLEKWGVKDVQISGIGPIPAEEQKKILDAHGMKVCVTHKDFAWMQNDIADVIAHHKTIDCDAIGIGSAPGPARGNSANVRKFIKEAEAVGAALKPAGMTFNYHSHAFEFYRLDDHKNCMMDLLIDEADPALFNFIPDVGWAHFAGCDPVELLKRMKGRVKVLHFKDYAFDNEGYRRFTSLGKGLVNLKDCYEAACELEIPYIAYEQDNDWVDGDAFKATEESWDFMQSLLK